MIFDDNGNLLTRTDPSGTLTYTWDARNRLIALTGPNLTASFAYDGLGRRAQKTITSVLTQFRYDGLDAVLESSGGSDASYLRTLSIDEALARTDVGGTAHYLGDALGSSVALTTPGGTAATMYTYEPFGRTDTAGTPNPNPFRFTGREDDSTGLYYYRARYYDPGRGRFVSEDPIGFSGGDMNIYVYVLGNPLRWIDPFGLWNCRAKGGCRPNSAMNNALKCVDTCAGSDVNVTFARGYHADLGRRSNPSLCRGKMEDCFAQCFPKDGYGQEEQNDPNVYPDSTHYHLLTQPSKSGTTGFQRGVIGYNQSR